MVFNASHFSVSFFIPFTFVVVADWSVAFFSQTLNFFSFFCPENPNFDTKKNQQNGTKIKKQKQKNLQKIKKKIKKNKNKKKP